MRTKIWSAEDGSCPVTLSGHTAAVTHTAIVERGRNVITVSKDGHVRVWNCAQQKSIEPSIAIEDCINCVDITDSNMNILNNADDDMTTESDDENLEFGTHGKILLIGTENGTVHLVDVKGRSVINSVRLDSAVNR